MHDASPTDRRSCEADEQPFLRETATLESWPLQVRRCRGYGVGGEEQFTAMHETRFRCRLRREGLLADGWVVAVTHIYRDGVDKLNEWDISFAEELGEDSFAQKTFEDTLYYHIGKSMFRPMLKINVTVAGVIELKACRCHFLLC